MWEILEYLCYCFCLFDCLFLLLNQGNNKIFPKQTSWNGFVAIRLFFFSLKQMKWYGIIILFSFCWNNHWTDLGDSLDNSAISFYSSRTWPGFFKGRGGEEEGCHTVSNREYSPDCHVDLSWIGYSGILRRPVPLSPLFISSACHNLIAIVNYWGKISVGNEEEKCNNCSRHLKFNVSHDYKTGAQKPVSLRKVPTFHLFSSSPSFSKYGLW